MIENRIKAMRKEAGMSQKELGELLGVGQTTVSAWEIGRNEPDNESLAKMGKLFGCSIGYLSGYEKETPKRGLSDEEWNAFNTRQYEKLQKQREEKEIEKAIQRTEEQHGKADEDMEKMLDAELYEELKRLGFPVYMESLKIDKCFEQHNSTEGQRKKVLRMAELMLENE